VPGRDPIFRTPQRIRRHFNEEEELFFAPLVDRDDVRTLIVRALVEHLRLHRDVRVLRRQLSVGEVAPELLVEIAEVLEKHVRFEEQELFPMIERLVPEDDLLDLAKAGHRDV
jgi:hemerythrin-like domain-containing protein